MKIFRKPVVITIALLAAIINAHAQSATGSISGAITLPAKAWVAANIRIVTRTVSLDTFLLLDGMNGAALLLPACAKH